MDGEENEGQRGNIGNEIFEQVEKIIQEEGLSRTNAFQRLSEMTGRRAGTVAANYYRVARQRGATLQPRAPRGFQEPRRPRAARAAVAAATPTRRCRGRWSRSRSSPASCAARRRSSSRCARRSQQVEKLKGMLSKL